MEFILESVIVLILGVLGIWQYKKGNFKALYVSFGIGFAYLVKGMYTNVMLAIRNNVAVDHGNISAYIVVYLVVILTTYFVCKPKSVSQFSKIDDNTELEKAWEDME